MAELDKVFSTIYAQGVWGNGSGAGSDPANVEEYVRFLQDFIRDRSIRSIVDCGCGDWQLMRHIDLSGVDYLGIDLVPDVLARNQAEFGRPGVRFELGNFTEMALPAADLLLCKDVLQHLPDRNVFRFLAGLDRFKFALLTNDLGRNADRDATLAASSWHFAPIDLTAAPFNLRAREVCRTMGIKSTLLVTREDERAAPRDPAGKVSEPPRILLAILAKQKEAVLPLFLRCIDALDYPKSRISLWVRTNNNTDETPRLLTEWLARVGSEYAEVRFDDADVDAKVQRFGVHEWNPERFRVLAALRQQSMEATVSLGCDYYFVIDVDNFLRPGTLRELVALRLPIVAPLLHHEQAGHRYSNYHFKTDRRGYYLDCPEYDFVLTGRIRGAIEVDVVHCTYLVRADVIDRLSYIDDSGRHEYVVFSESARRNGVPQYLDNRQVYGYLSLTESSERSAGYLDAELTAAEVARTATLRR
jgi:SAM-dependent methyltransferase